MPESTPKPTSEVSSGYEVKSEDKPAEKPSESGAPTEGKGDNLDEFGYEKVAEVEGDKKPEGKDDTKSEVPKPESKIETPATGYGDEPPKVEEPPVTPKPEEKIDLGFELKTEGLPETLSKEIKAFVKEHKISEAAAKAIVEREKTIVANVAASKVEADKNFEREKAKVRSDWHKELKSDPVFGGEKFAHNVHRAEKIVEELMPELKKELTSRGSMLPPYVMRGLARIADKLYSTEKLIQGDAPKPDEAKVEVDDALAFYQ
jgi:hypothetical protein